MTVLGLVLSTRYMNPEVTTVGGLHDKLIEVGVGLEP